jgi:hypothetical protein
MAVRRQRRLLRRDSFCESHYQVNDGFGRAGVAVFMTHVGLELDRIASHQPVMHLADYHFERAAGHNQIFDGAWRMGLCALTR